MPKKEPSFEQLYEELEATVQKLEAGNLSLDESLALYERGMELAQQCGAQLDRAELRVKELAPAVASELEEEYDLDEEESE
jgi:exodeoxyribonuclease VII small subunit